MTTYVSSVAVRHTSTSFVETIAGNKAHSILAFFESGNIFCRAAWSTRVSG